MKSYLLYFNLRFFLSLVFSLYYGIVFSLNQNDTIDITDELIRKINTEKKILIPAGIYFVNAQIIFKKSNITIIGESKVKLIFKSKKSISQNMFLIYGCNIRFENINFDGNNDNVNVSLLQVGNQTQEEPSKNISFLNCSFENIKGSMNGSDFVYGIRILINKCQNVKLKNCTFRNISAYDKDSKEGFGGGFCGGVFLFSDEPLENVAFPSNVSIEKCLFENIFTENFSKNGWDADGIRTYSTNTNPEKLKIKSGLKIINNKFIDVQKSAMKICSMNNVKILNNSIINNSNQEMLCAIRIQWGKNIIVKNTKIAGKFQFGLNLIGENLKIVNIISDKIRPTVISKKMINYQILEIIENKNIKLKNIK